MTAVVPFGLDECYDLGAVLDAVFDGGAGRVDFGAPDGQDEVVTALARLDGVTVGVVQPRRAPAGSDRPWRVSPYRPACVCACRYLPLVFVVDSIALAAECFAGLVELSALRQTLATATVVPAAPLKPVVISGRAQGLAATLVGAVVARADYVAAWPRAQIALVSATAMSSGRQHR